MTSPCNTIGCSYAPPDEEPYFHQVWINAYPTCCVRDTFQTQMRVRHLKNNVMKFCLPDKKAMLFCKARYELKFDLMDAFEDFNCQKKELIGDIINRLAEQNKGWCWCNPFFPTGQPTVQLTVKLSATY